MLPKTISATLIEHNTTCNNVNTKKCTHAHEIIFIEVNEDEEKLITVVFFREFTTDYLTGRKPSLVIPCSTIITMVFKRINLFIDLRMSV
jgi:hypothetical protein